MALILLIVLIFYCRSPNPSVDSIGLEEIKTHDIDEDNKDVDNKAVDKTSVSSMQDKVHLNLINNIEDKNNVEVSGSLTTPRKDIPPDETHSERESSPFPITVEAQLEGVTESGPRNDSEMVFCSSNSTPTSIRAGRSFSSSGPQNTNSQEVPECRPQSVNGANHGPQTPHCLFDITEAEVTTEPRDVTENGPNTHDLVSPAQQCTVRPNHESVGSQMERMHQHHDVQLDSSNLPNNDRTNVSN